jgi:tetratricopeptide (TPR) repeat protein
VTSAPASRTPAVTAAGSRPAIAAAPPSATTSPLARQPAATALAATHHIAAAPGTRAAVAAEFARLEQECRKAFGQRRYKEVLESCARAFDAKPDAADIAVLLAEVEFDRGRSSASLGWARKAVAVNPRLADAYVYIGSAEQQSGHGQAARIAYQKYLELAPTGRYATDLRAVLRGL